MYVKVAQTATCGPSSVSHTGSAIKHQSNALETDCVEPKHSMYDLATMVSYLSETTIKALTDDVLHTHTQSAVQCPPMYATSE